MRKFKPRSVFAKAVYDRRWFLLGWLFGLIFLSWFVGIFYKSFGASTALNEQFQQLPPALRSVAGITGDFNSVPGYFGSQIFGKTMPMVAAILGIMLGTGLATEEEDGTLQTLLSAPISRLKVYASKWLAAVMIFAVITLGLGAGLALSLWQLQLSLNASYVALAMMNVWLFTVFFFTLTYSMGAIWGKRSTAIAIGSLVAVAGYLLNTMAAAVEELKPYDKLSAYYYYGGQNVLEKGMDWLRFELLLGFIGLLLIVGALIFTRRDISST